MKNSIELINRDRRGRDHDNIAGYGLVCGYVADNVSNALLKACATFGDK